MEQLLTIAEMSNLLQASSGTIYKWTHAGFIPHLKIGGHLRFREKDVSIWLEKRCVPGRKTLKYEINNL